MTNYISRLGNDKLASLGSKLDIIDLYSRTGKDYSNFFPLLNYAAMRLLTGYEKECEIAALDWIDKNIHHFIFSNGNDITKGFTITRVNGVEKSDSDVIFLGESYNIGLATMLQRRDFFYMLCVGTSNPNKTMLTWVCPLIVKSLRRSISDSLEEAIKSRKNDIESFPSERQVMRLMKDYRHSGDGVFHRLPKIAGMKAQSSERYVIFPVIACENPFEGEGKYICKYDMQSKECMLFNGKKIMSIPDSIDVYATEPDDSMALEIMHGYIDGVRRMKCAVDNAESQRNALLALT